MKRLLLTLVVMLFLVSCDTKEDSKGIKSIGVTLTYVALDDRFDEVYVYPNELRAVLGDEEYIFDTVEAMNRWISKNVNPDIDFWINEE